MNKKVYTTQIQGGQGIFVSCNETTNNVYANGDYVDVVQTTTHISVDPTSMGSVIDNYLSYGNGSTFLQNKIQQHMNDTLAVLLKNNLKFEIVQWNDENQKPTFTCMITYNGNVIAEKDIKHGDI